MVKKRPAVRPIDDEALRNRYEKKRNADLDEIYERMQQVEVERAYRIVGNLEKKARDVEEHMVPALLDLIRVWRKRTLIGDALVLALALGAFLFGSIQMGQWDGWHYRAAWWDWVSSTPLRGYLSALGGYIVWLALHFGVRRLAAKSVISLARRLSVRPGIHGNLPDAFLANTVMWRSVFNRKPRGWTRRNRHLVSEVLEDTDRYVQDLNDSFTNPSGSRLEAREPNEPILGETEAAIAQE